MNSKHYTHTHTHTPSNCYDEQKTCKLTVTTLRSNGNNLCYRLYNLNDRERERERAEKFDCRVGTE